MKILAIETATVVSGVAVLDGARELAVVEDGARPHAAALLPAVERALAEAGLGLPDIEGFAVSIGPGSFTGLRIGLATLKAFALGDVKPIAPVPTLAALAWPRRGAGCDVVACLDAQRGELYAAVYRPAEDGLAVVEREAVVTPEALAPLRAAGAEVVMGHAPRAPDVAAIGARILARGGGVTAAELLPRYVRRAEAEARRLGQALEAHNVSSGPPELL